MKSFLVLFAFLVVCSAATLGGALNDNNEQQDQAIDDFLVIRRGHGTIQVEKEVKVSENEIGAPISNECGGYACLACYAGCMLVTRGQGRCLGYCEEITSLKIQVGGDAKAMDEDRKTEVDQVFKKEDVIFTGPRKQMQQKKKGRSIVIVDDN